MMVREMLSGAQWLGKGELGELSGAAGYLPGVSDYWLARVIHELGWAAGLALLALMTALFALGLRRCMRQRGMLGRLLSTAALTTLVLETVCFVVYDLGFPLAAPLVLPFLSTGGRYMVVNLLLEAIPDLQLRLDANRAWTPLKAQQFAKYVNPAYRQRIAFLEEPCKTREDSRAFSRETGIAIAWDESLREADFRFVAEPGVRAVVIKPTLTGSLQKVQQQVAAAHALGLSVVISSSIESSLGLTQLARVAAWLTPQTIPGLDTLALMGAQLVRPWPESALPVLNIDALEPLL